MVVYVAAGFIAGAWCGALLGMLLWNEVVTSVWRDAAVLERQHGLAARDAWRDMYEYAAREHAATSKAFADMLRDNEGHSRKVVPLRGVS